MSDDGRDFWRTIRWFAATLAAAAFTLTAAAPAAAQEEESEEPSVSLGNLAVVEVVTASKSEESIMDAPGVVTTVSKAEIERFGAESLHDVLQRLPSVYPTGSTMLRRNVLAIRGDAPSHTSPHVLVLLNGRPMRDNVFGGFNGGIYTSFPVEAIQRLEVVRGPGSVLYGTNAYAGVVNIITEPAGESGATLAAGGGDDGATLADAAVDVASGDFRMSTHVDGFEYDGWQFDARFPRGRHTGRFGEERIGGTLDLAYRGLRATVFAGVSTLGNLPAHPVGALPPQEVTYGRVFADVGWEEEVVDGWTTELNVTFNHMDTDFVGTNGIESRPSSDDWVVELSNHVSPAEDVNLVIGGAANMQSGVFALENGKKSVPSYDRTWWRGYLQADWRPAEPVKLIAGGQVNKPNGVDANFSPRLGAVLTATDELGAKLLWGEAFRAAFPGETKIRIPGTLKGGSNLEPETVTTFDAQLFYHGGPIQVTGTYFRSDQEDLISRVPSPDPNFRLSYANQGTLESEGVELETKLQPGAGFYVVGSLAYQTNEDDRGREDVYQVPNTMVKGGVGWSNDAVTASLFDAWFDAPASNRQFNPDVAMLNPEVESHHMVTAHLELDVARVWDGLQVPVSISVFADNLLDTEVHRPETVFQRVNSVPVEDGRTVTARAEVSF